MNRRWYWLLAVGILGTVVLQAHALEAPRKRVMVEDFKDKGGQGALWAQLLRKALEKAGRYRVLEAAPLKVEGAVLEFGSRHQDVDGKVSAIETETARCVLDLGLLDTTTGRILARAQVAGEELLHHARSDHDASENLKSKAAQKALAQAAVFINKSLTNAPWYGQIVKSTPGYFLVDTGIEDRRTVGQEFDVVRAGEAVYDPHTGEVLGAQKTPVGRIRLTAVLGPQVSRAVALDGALPQPGDVIQ